MISVEALEGRSIAEQRIEVVERKGLGHPDTICDSIMEAISVALCEVYLDQFGTVLHHNIDKGLLAAGRVETHFGGGRVIKPMELSIGDRATFEAGGRMIPVREIAVEAARGWFTDHLRRVDPQRDVDYRVVLAPGSAELAGIFARDGALRAANDTSAGVGYYPLSPTEEAVLALERHLNSQSFKAQFPETGEDVKIMGLRDGRTLHLTVAMPLLAEHVGSEGEYFERKAAVHAAAQEFAGELAGFDAVEVALNALDEPGRGLNGVYLSLLGTSAEDADSGQVGRGNRVNGLIALNRPLGTEAAAGKNPVSHVGKIYNVLAHELAREVCGRVAGVREAQVLLLSRIGTPVDQPQLANVQLRLDNWISINEIKEEVNVIIQDRLKSLSRFCLDLARGRYPIC